MSTPSVTDLQLTKSTKSSNKTARTRRAKSNNDNSNKVSNKLNKVSNTEKEANNPHGHSLTSRWLDRQQCDEMGIKYKKGKFTAEEDRKVKQALNDYKTLHNLDDDGIRDLIYGRNNTEHKKFWTSIATQIGTRPIRTLALHVQRKYHPFNYTGTWSPEEDEELNRLVSIYHHDWTTIGYQMDRTGQQCRDRWRDYVEYQNEKQLGKWSNEEEEKLTNIIVDLTKENNADITTDWGIPRYSLRLKYELKNGIIAKWSDSDSYTLVNKLLKCGALEELEVNWEELISNENWGPWTPEVLKDCWRRLKYTVKDFSAKSFRDVAVEILDRYNETTKTYKATFSNPRITYPSPSPSPPVSSSSFKGKSSKLKNSTLSKESNASDLDQESDKESTNQTIECPYCFEPLPNPLPLKLKEKLAQIDKSKGKKRKSFFDDDEFCKLHEAELKIISQGISKGYPRIIDYDQLPARIKKLKKKLKKIILGKVKSKYRKQALETYRKIGRRAKLPMSVMSRFETLRPGYFGPKGAEIIMETLMNMFTKKKNILTAELAKPQSIVEYLQEVLVPETCIRLIREDYNNKGESSHKDDKNKKRKWSADESEKNIKKKKRKAEGGGSGKISRKEAKIIMKESAEYGECLNGE
ncbi:3013_t:CDS:10 [Diversispora eburnea]|uniref:3013_t:CDS:1 n=1 Tax=Diversispora eburnea TaxID=1213867 RepID=A0A9N9AAH1_9GLOM|nr:3013_t:CDS:10 [Diversispora eburnea]